jgi:hypothetical protein
MASSPPNLRQILETVDDRFFNYIPLTQAEREAYATQIISYQILTGPAAGMFNSGSTDSNSAPRLFSGERIYTQLAARHTLLIDSVRILTLLKVGNRAVTRALELAKQKMASRCYANFCAVGECRHLTIAFMRYLIACNSPEGNQQLGGFLTQLATHHDTQNRWRSFPFYYTLLMLSETDHPLAIQEQNSVSPVCATLLDRTWDNGLYSVRRKTILYRTRGGDA